MFWSIEWRSNIALSLNLLITLHIVNSHIIFAIGNRFVFGSCFHCYLWCTFSRFCRSFLWNKSIMKKPWTVNLCVNVGDKQEWRLCESPPLAWPRRFLEARQPTSLLPTRATTYPLDQRKRFRDHLVWNAQRILVPRCQRYTRLSS